MSVAVREYRMLIGGEWVGAASGETFETVNPYTGRPWALVPRAGAFDVHRAVTAERRSEGGGRWRRWSAAACCGASPS
jgi:aldehyde dehydrogenase (NAD+)